MPSHEVGLRGMDLGVVGAEPLAVGTRRSGAGVTCLHMAETAKLGWAGTSVSPSSFVRIVSAGVT